MKKIIPVFAGLSLLLSATVFAVEKHGAAALEHARAAVESGKANSTTELVKHANAALEHALASALVLTGPAKVHMEAASSELEEAVNHGRLRHIDVATEHAEAAVTHIEAGNK